MQPRPLTPDRKRHVTRCLGCLRPEAVYTVEGLLRYAGIGRDVLLQARASGLVHPIPIGRRVYYLGAEVVQWIASQRLQKGESDDRDDSEHRAGRAEELDARA